jgi:hypothetical protein
VHTIVASVGMSKGLCLLFAYTLRMHPESRLRSWGVLVCLVLVYAVVVGVSPALHHDVQCHLKSPTHCPACLANPVASPAESAQDLAAVSLASAGEIERFRASCPASAGFVYRTGRAPPA